MQRTGYFYIYNHKKKNSSSKLRRIINYRQSTMVLTRCCKRLVLWHTNWSFLLLPECTQFSMFHAYRRLQVKNFQFKQYCRNLMRKEKSYWNMKQPRKQELDSYKIDQFQSISSSGRTYPLKLPHGRTRILYRSIKNYSSVEDNAF